MNGAKKLVREEYYKQITAALFYRNRIEAHQWIVARHLSCSLSLSLSFSLFLSHSLSLSLLFLSIYISFFPVSLSLFQPCISLPPLSLFLSFSIPPLSSPSPSPTHVSLLSFSHQCLSFSLSVAGSLSPSLYPCLSSYLSISHHASISVVLTLS